MARQEKKQELEKWLFGEGDPQKYSPLDSLAELLKAIADMLDGEACAEVILDRVADLIEAVNHNSPEDKQAESNVKKTAVQLIQKLILKGF